jgi:hypothetical protein
MSMKALKKALKGKNVDKFDVGTVIRWKASGTYNYAAIKAGNGQWYTTAASFNSYVSQIVDFDGLCDILSRSETDEIEVSTVWERVE